MKIHSQKELEAQYAMLMRIAIESDFDLAPAFIAELKQLTNLLKAMGSKVV
jgi:hypothetical protein